MESDTANEVALRAFVDRVGTAVEASSDEHLVTAEVASALTELLSGGFELGPEFTRAHPDHYVMYPVYVDPQERFSVAAAVWNVGQSTPVHGHETWGVVGIYEGVELETRFVKPTVADVPLEVAERDLEWGAGDVTVCCTTDDDVHTVACGGDVPCVGIHVYGTNIGTLQRRKYVAETGEVGWFVSAWAGQ